MSQSEKIDQLAAALVEAQKRIGPIAKNATNPHLRNKYADLEAIWEAVRPVLGDCGLAVSQGGEEGPEGVQRVATLLMHTSGQWIKWIQDVPVEQTRGINAPQAAGVSNTYGRRYGLQALVFAVADDDLDGEASPNGRPPQPRETSKPAQRAAAPAKPARQAPDSQSGDIPTDPPLCPVCAGEMWDNREDAQGTKKPRWKCKAATWDKETRTSGGCPGVVWRSDPLSDEKYVAAWSGKANPATAQDDEPPPRGDSTEALRQQCRRTLAESLVEAGVDKTVQPSKVARLLANQFSKERLDELDHGELAVIVQGINSVDWDECTMDIPF